MGMGHPMAHEDANQYTIIVYVCTYTSINNTHTIYNAIFHHLWEPFTLMQDETNMRFGTLHCMQINVVLLTYYKCSVWYIYNIVERVRSTHTINKNLIWCPVLCSVACYMPKNILTNLWGKYIKKILWQIHSHLPNTVIWTVDIKL